MITQQLRCKTCALWKEIEGLGERVGQCRHDAPVCGDRIPAHEPIAFYGEWPFTGPEDFCGKHVAKLREEKNGDQKPRKTLLSTE